MKKWRIKELIHQPVHFSLSGKCTWNEIPFLSRDIKVLRRRSSCCGKSFQGCPSNILISSEECQNTFIFAAAANSSLSAPVDVKGAEEEEDMEPRNKPLQRESDSLGRNFVTFRSS